MARRWRWPFTRRGRFYGLPSQPVAAPPPAPPYLRQAEQRPAVAPRRGQFGQPPWPWPPQVGYTSGGGAVASFSLTVPGGVQPGYLGLLVVAWAVSGANETLTVTATSGAGNTWSTVTPSVGANNLGFAFLYRVAQPGDAATVAVTLSSGRFTMAAAGWYPNVGGVGVVGGLGNRAGVTQTTTTAPGITTSGAGRLVAGLFAERTAAAGTQVSLDQGGARVYVEDTSAGASSALISDFTAAGTSTGSLTASYTGSGSGNGVGVLVELLPVGVAPVVPAVTRPRSRLGLPSRRGRVLPVPAAAVTITPPVYPPQVTRQPQLRLPGLRRRRPAEPPWPVAVPAAPTVPAQVRQAWRPRVGSIRRGAFQPVVPAPVVAGPGPHIPRVTRPALRRGFVPRRGEFFPPPAPQGALAGPGPLAPRLLRQPGPRPPFGWRTRDRFYEPPWPPAVPVPAAVPTRVVGRRPLAPRVVRRGRSDPPWTPAPRVPGLLSGRRPQAPPTRRGRFFERPWVGLSIGPGPVAPQLRSTRRRFGFRARRGRFAEPVWLPAPFSIGQLAGATTATSGLTAASSPAAQLAPSSSSGGPT